VGHDQAASVEIVGLVKLVSNIRDIEKSMGDGVKKVHEKEIQQRNKLRRVRSAPQPIAAPVVADKGANGTAEA